MPVNHLLVLAAIVLAVLAAIFAFFVDAVAARTVVGLLATSLACWYASAWPDDRIGR